MAMENTGSCFMFHVEHWMGFGWGGETNIKNSIRICAVKKY